MNTPKIRFKGFTDDWEQRKLGDVFKEYSEKHHEELPALTIVQGGGTILREESDRSLQYDKSNLSGYKMVKKDDFIVHLRSFEGGLEKANSDGIISPAYHTMHGDNVDSRFYYPYFRSYDFINRKLVAHVYGIRDGRSIDIDGMKSIEIPYTSYEEQKTIGDYLDSLDYLITLHQRKCDETKQLKKFMLQKMFPKNGEKNPKIRFEGFTDDWEQRKVGEFLTESRESGHKGDIAHKMTVKLWGKGVYEKKETGSANTQYFTRHAGQFIYSKLDFLNCAFGVVTEELENLETTADVPAFDCDGVNPYFMFYTAIQPRFYEKNGMIADGSRKAKRIHADTFLDMPFFVPSLKEQNKIVNLLSELDNLITLHQRKCEKLKALKKFMLQNMFI